MSVRGFVGWYVVAVVLIGATGVGAYQALFRMHVTAPQTVAAVATESAGDALQMPSPPATVGAAASAQTPHANSEPRPRRHAEATSKGTSQHRSKLVFAGHTPPPRSPMAFRSARRDLAAYRPPGPYEPEPPPVYSPAGRYYADPSYYPYPNYYVRYPPYGYYRGF